MTGVDGLRHRFSNVRPLPRQHHFGGVLGGRRTNLLVRRKKGIWIVCGWFNVEKRRKTKQKLAKTWQKLSCLQTPLSEWWCNAIVPVDFCTSVFTHTKLQLFDLHFEAKKHPKQVAFPGFLVFFSPLDFRFTTSLWVDCFCCKKTFLPESLTTLGWSPKLQGIWASRPSLLLMWFFGSWSYNGNSGGAGGVAAQLLSECLRFTADVGELGKKGMENSDEL